MLTPEETGITRNPVPMGNAVRTASGIKAQQPALLRYDRSLPSVLTAEEIGRFLSQLTATRFRDRALVYLMWSAGLRINEGLSLKLEDIDWAQAMLTVRSPKNRRPRRIPVGRDALAMLSNYVRRERPKTLEHDFVFVCLGRRNYGKPMSYKAWIYICEQARQKANLPQVHAHAFRHTAATDLAEGGMSLEALMKQLGHAHLDTVMVYTQVRNTRLAREFRQATGEENPNDNH
jgi:integrase/recombinase XerD